MTTLNFNSDPETKTTDVHEAMSSAATEFTHVKKDAMVTIKMESQLKALTEQICENNGTTISGYLRSCCKALVQDYLGVKE